LPIGLYMKKLFYGKLFTGFAFGLKVVKYLEWSLSGRCGWWWLHMVHTGLLVQKRISNDT